jgi:hypothetical protein
MGLKHSLSEVGLVSTHLTSPGLSFPSRRPKQRIAVNVDHLIEVCRH